MVRDGVIKPVGTYPDYIPIGARRYYLDDAILLLSRTLQQVLIDAVALLATAAVVLAVVWRLLAMMN